MINGVSQAQCAFIPASDSTIPERRRDARKTLHSPSKRERKSPDLFKRASNAGAYYPETNYCGNLSTAFFNLTLVANKTYRLRLVNSGTFVNSLFSIDNHTLTIIEADGVSTEPYNVSVIDIAVAQRYSALVTLDQAPAAYWIRNDLATDQLRYTGNIFNETTFGVLRYQGVDPSIMPPDLPAPGSDLPSLDSLDSTILTPAEPQNALPPTQVQYVQFNMQYSADGQHYMFFNSSSWTALPPGQASVFGVTSSSNVSTWNVGNQVNFVNDGPGVFDLVVRSQDDGKHPFHLHGHTFQIMSQGDGAFLGPTSALNVTNPMRRDTVAITSYGHLVLRFTTDNRKSLDASWLSASACRDHH